MLLLSTRNAAVGRLRVSVPRVMIVQAAAHRRTEFIGRDLRLLSAESNHCFSITGTLPSGGRGVAVSQYAEVQRVFSVEEVAQFGRLIGDDNPLHSPQASFPDNFEALERAGIIQWMTTDEQGSHVKRQSRVLVHGMLAGSLFSCIFGALIPGSVYRSQHLTFCAPVFCNQAVTGRIEVIKLRQWRHEGLVLMCDTTVKSQGRVCITGQATVWLPNATLKEEDSTTS